MDRHSTVLIVDRSSESRDVLCTLLERSGTRAYGVDGPLEAVRAANATCPDLIVVDLDNAADFDGREAACRQIGEAAGRTNTPIVVIGSIRPNNDQIPSSRFVAKPYHYRDLLRRIDQLLGKAA